MNLIVFQFDLIHFQVNESEGASLAAQYSVEFCEVSVADNTPNLYKAFERILNDSKGRPVKQRKFSVSKMIGKQLMQLVFVCHFVRSIEIFNGHYDCDLPFAIGMLVYLIFFAK